MAAFRVCLVMMWMVLASYTALVLVKHGPDLWSVFIGNMRAVDWAGQFNLDFLFMLTLSALWVAWRNSFSGSGLALAFMALIGGILFLTAYLLVLTIRANGNIKQVLVGPKRAEA
jgi:hypothetical protein